jgi:hypothetical protein
MSMIKRANGQIETFTSEEGKEVDAQNDVVWADEKKQEVIKDALDIPVIDDITLDTERTDTSDDVIARDC